MDFDAIRLWIEEVTNRLQVIKKALTYETLVEDLKKLEEKTLENGFWEDQKAQSVVLAQMKEKKDKIEKLEKLEEQVKEAKGYLEMAEELKDSESLKESEKICKWLTTKLDKLEMDTLLSEEYDSYNAIITIHPGAGGTESQDWALMLYRMYTKWASRQELALEVLDLQDGEEAGIKSVSVLVKGTNAYGYLKGENGVHRLVRISPFDSNSRRHTSFAAVEVMPEIADDITVQIHPEDIQMDVYRASGAGGQHVNKTSSAVRLKHVPTGIVVTCQTERSQLQNRENAMKMLKAKLYRLEKQNHESKLNGIKGESLENGWGSQIRSYVFCPYTLVKDHRTNYEVGNVSGVMDGKIEDFIYEYLRYKNRS